MHVKLCAAGILLLVGLAKAAEDRSGWIDPNDMLNFDPSTNTMQNKGEKVKAQDPKESATDSESSSRTATRTDSESSSRTATRTDQASEKPPVHVPDCSPCPEVPSCPPCPEPLPPDCPNVCSGDQGMPLQSKDDACDGASLPLLRQYVRELRKHLDGKVPQTGNGDFTMHISLSANQITILDRFIEEGRQTHVSDVHEILNSMVERVVTSHLGGMEKSMLYIEDKIGIKLDRVVQLFQLAALASFVLFLEVKLQIPWRRRISQVVVLMFCVSIPWTWIELYKQAEIRQHTLLQKDRPSECTGDEDNFWTAFKSYITLQDDKCQDYYEHLLIDPLYKIPPTKAIGITFVRFFVSPMKDIGTAMSEFIRALLIDLPVTLYPVAIAIVSIFLFLFLFMWFGYSIRLPFFISIEKSPQLTLAESQLQQTIQDGNQKTMKQLEELQSLLAATEAQIHEKLDTMGKAQKLAIEFNQSSNSDDRFPSPTLSCDNFKFESGSTVNSQFDNMRSKSPTKSPTKPPRASKSSPTKIPCASKVQEVNRSPKKNLAGDMNPPPASRSEERLLRSCDNVRGEGYGDGEDLIDGVNVGGLDDVRANVHSADQDAENISTRQTKHEGLKKQGYQT